MFSLTINGNTPAELFVNLKKMVEAQSANPIPTVPGPSTLPAAGTPTSYTAPTPAIVPVLSPTVQPVPVAANVPAAQAPNNSTLTTAATVSPLGPVPVAAAPAYTLEQLSRAGAALLPGKMTEVQALLAKYGVKSAHELPVEYYGAFATDLRLLGANI